MMKKMKIKRSEEKKERGVKINFEEEVIFIYLFLKKKKLMKDNHLKKVTCE